MPRFVKYPDWLVAKIKGAREAGLPIKQIAKRANMNPDAVKDLVRATYRIHVEPDPSLAAMIDDWFHKTGG